MKTVEIAGRSIGDGEPVFIVAEMSANHDRDLNQALALVDVAAQAGVDALKLQTYTPESLTMQTSHPSARTDPKAGADTLWELYQKAAMPYDFHKPLFERTSELGMVAFSTAYDEEAVGFLEELEVPAYKIASFELLHYPLLREVARTGKPVILSTGMAGIGEVEEALNVLVSAGSDQIILLHCCTMYPADPAMVNLAAMQTLRQAFGFPVGFSDHTLGCSVPIAAAALGACMIEKHYTNDPQRTGPDHRFSLSPDDLNRMVEGIRKTTAAIGSGKKIRAPGEVEEAAERRSLYAAVDISAGTEITRSMVNIIRPGGGLHPRFLELLVGRVTRKDIPAGWPITWDDV
jgi:pseudaminic acid synthase